MRTLDEQSQERLLDAVFRFQLALVSNSRISSDAFAATQKEARESFEDIKGNLRPWTEQDREERQNKESQTFKEQWKALAGFDPSDEEAIAKWSEELNKVLKAGAQAREIQAQEAENQEKLVQFKFEEIRRKRALQQGRK